jgi:hypothetical protein
MAFGSERLSSTVRTNTNSSLEGTRMDRVFSMDQVRRERLVAVGTDVFDLRSFSPKHPGGDFLRHLEGTDATQALLAVHPKNLIMRRVLQRFRVGRLNPATVDPFDRAVLALRSELAAEGQFDYRRSWLCWDALRIGALFALGAGLSLIQPWLAFIALTAASIDLVWWIHDAGHDAIFSSEQRASRVIEVLGIVFLGMPQQGYHYGIHRIHHGFVNVIGADLALDTGPGRWREGLRAGCGRCRLRSGSSSSCRSPSRCCWGAR